MSLPAITKHLKVLESAGLISKGREAQWRPCKLNGEALKPAADWMDQYRRYWEESFDRLEEYLKTLTDDEAREKESERVETKTKKGRSRDDVKAKGKSKRK